MPSKSTLYQIPFDHDGNQLHYAGYGSYLANKVIWVDNREFIDTLAIVRMHRGRSAAYFSLVSKETGKQYTMFMRDMVDLITKHTIVTGSVSGKWTFQKRGCNFGVKAML